jgi:hypothetical protein
MNSDDLFRHVTTPSLYSQKYNEGYNAYTHGVELRNNPYDPHSRYGILWDFGWCSAADKDDE